MTDWAAFAVAVAVESGLAKGVYSLLNVPERLLEKHHDQRTLARSNVEANEILPQLAALFRSVNQWRAQNAGTEDVALVAVGYADTLATLSSSYEAYVRLDTLPTTIRRYALGLAILLLMGIVVVAALLYDPVRGTHSIPHNWRVAAAFVGIVTGTLAGVLGVVYYRARFALTRLLEKYA